MTQDDQEFRRLFAEQARREAGLTPGFERTLRQTTSPRLSMTRLAVAAGVFLMAGVGVSLVYQGLTRSQVERQAALPNLLEGLDDASNVSWQSPTAFLLDMSYTSGRSESAPPTGTNGSETRHSNG